ncbi:MAG: c-type cytochrome [Chloroflexota bacterium]|nr:c-type cytochrome [Chloroflexota bacterium]
MKEPNYSFLAYLGVVLTLAAILVLGLFSLKQPGQMYSSAKAHEHEAIERGDEVFEHDCATCHGVHGEGVRGSGPALNTQEFLSEAVDGLIFNTITDGRPGTSMPAWGQVRGGPYTAQVVDDLVAYIRSWEATAPSVEEMVFQGDPVSGAVLFSTTCYACHGVAGEGTAGGVALNDPERLARLTDDYYRDTIRRGRPDRGMPTWGSVLSPEEVEDLLAYIRSWQIEPPAIMADLGGDLTRGKEIFTSTCVACHGEGGIGTDLAPRLAEAPVLNDPHQVHTVVSEGRLDKGMPNWGQVLSPAEINDVVAYVSTLRADGSVAGETLVEEDDSLDRAQFLFLQQCAECHGLTGEGKDDKPALVDNEFVQTNDDQALFNIVAGGRANTAMEGFSGELSDEEIQEIIKLLHTWQ